LSRVWTHLLIPPLLVCLGAGLLVLGLASPAEQRGPADASAGRLAALLPEVLPPERPTPAEVVLAVREGDALLFHQLIVTGYTSSVHETDSTPYVTASMTRVRPGCLALSRDLLRTFTADAPFDFGDWVVLPGIGIFIIEDTMNVRWRNRADIWFPDRRQALAWGRRKALIARLPQPLEEGHDLFALGPARATGF
jgi:3D (Asp-Asp-Asp) domain-containing protein